MLILSQKKDEIVNLDNVVNFRLGYNGNFIVRAENHEKVCELGEYATEERAKEVLQEIIEQYEYCQVLQEGHGISLSSGNNYVYAMPGK